MDESAEPDDAGASEWLIRDCLRVRQSKIDYREVARRRQQERIALAALVHEALGNDLAAEPETALREGA